MGVTVCDECMAVKVEQDTVGQLLDEAFIFYKEGIRKDDLKLIRALNKYYEALKGLENGGGHADCINYIANEYRRLYKTIAGSRA